MRISLLALFLIVNIVYAESVLEHYELSLENQKKLNLAIESSLNDVRSKETLLEKELRTLETDVSQASYKLYGLKTKMANLQGSRERIALEQEKRGQELLVKKQLLIEQVRFAYLTGNSNVLAALVGDKRHSSQVSAWYNYLTQKKTAHLNALSADMAKQSLLSRSIRSKYEVLRGLRQDKGRVQKTLSEKKKLKLVSLAKLKQELAAGAQHLVLGKREQADLMDTLARLKISIGKTPIIPMDLTRFEGKKGRLQWPVTQKKMSPVKDSRAVVFGSSLNSQVFAVAEGRVVFSDWMRGYGLLIIVDHGGGYMSLYGRNKSLFKGRGEWVRPGELLAKVGNTGGLVGTGLYFELRCNGKSLGVGKWFS